MLFFIRSCVSLISLRVEESCLIMGVVFEKFPIIHTKTFNVTVSSREEKSVSCGKSGDGDLSLAVSAAVLKLEI